ncbi:MAG TPA: YncE family protein [Polyangia bacterium]|jgi:YVTN family beta-propeller protein|nr:YncE family protein [Polyangia bacterium]
MKMQIRNRGGALCALLMTTVCSCNSNGNNQTAAVALKAYVGLFGDKAVAVIDTSTNQVTNTIPVPTGPHGLVVTPDGAKVFVSSDGSSTVSVIATASDTVIASVDVGMTPHGLSISSDGKRVVCAGYGTDSVQVIDSATNQVVTRVAVPRPHNSTISPDGKLAYVGSQQKDTPSIAVVDLDAGSVIASVPLANPPRALDFASAGTVYFTVGGLDVLESLDPVTGQLAATPIATGGSPHHMIATKDGAFELVVSQTVGDLEYVDATTRAVTAQVPTGMTPHWIARSPDGGRAYVTNEGSNTVSVVDLAQRTVVATIPVGNGPRKIAVQPVVAGP